ncbi:MAG: MFS transporter [Chloroflexi bacterium]|nr:MFS transporter [Chloroflexota bacterium]
MEQTAPATGIASITDRQRVMLLFSAVAGHALKHMFNAAFFVILPEMKTSLGLSNTEVGALSTVRNIAGGLSNLPAGFAADRFSAQRAKILAISMTLVGLFAMTLGLATNFAMALVAAALLSVAITFWHPAAISTLSRVFASRRGFAIAMHGTGGSIGEAGGPILVGLLLGVLSWRVVLQGSVLPGIACGLLVWLLLRPIPTGEGAAPSFLSFVKAMGRLLSTRRLLLILLFAGGFAGGQSAILTFLPVYLREEVGVSSWTLGLYLALANVGGIVSQPVMGYLSDRLSRKVVLVPSLAGLGLSVLGLYVSSPGIVFAMMVLLMGVFLFPLMAILLAAAVDLVEGAVQATTISLVFGSAVVFSGFTPAIAGMVADAFSVKAVFLLAASIILATAFLAFVTPWQAAKVRRG